MKLLRALLTSPLLSSCALAIIIDCFSNIIAQRLKAYSLSVPFVFDRVLFLQFAFMGAIGAPVNFHWQNWLERTFPGWVVVTRRTHVGRSEKDSDDGVGDAEKGEWGGGVAGVGLMEKEESVRVRKWGNVGKKWFTDCITLGALLNTSLFLVVMGLLKGKGWGVIGGDLRTVGEPFFVLGLMLTE